jgi:UDP-N-acetyl-D-galactosamine dehydrogenase
LKKKLYPCVIGLGYVGLPLFLQLQKHFRVVGFDINDERIAELRKNNDINNEFRDYELKPRNNSLYTHDQRQIKDCNFYIVTVPTPVFKNNAPNINYLKLAARLLSKKIKKGDIIIFESTVYPGLTNIISKKYLKSNLKEGKDFFIGYSPERVNPGDKIHSVNKITKIVSLNTKNKEVKKKTLYLYKKITKKIIFSNSIESAEAAKVIENIQRDLNIAFINEVLLFTNKMGYNFNEIMKLASSKWNFLNFKPGLVGGHCLPVDPYYLSYLAKKNNINLKILLAGRSVNNKMYDFAVNQIKKKITIFKNNRKINPNILFCGITYKPDVADIRNSQALKIFQKFKLKYRSKVQAYDYICDYKTKEKFNILSDINKAKKSFDIYIFLTCHKKNIKLYNFVKKNSIEFVDPFLSYNN